MTLSLMPFVVEIGIFGSLFFSLSLSLLAKAKRNVVISVEREREKRGWMDDGATPGVRSNEFTFHPLRIG